MADATTFFGELEGRNQDSFRRLASEYLAAVSKEAFSITDLLKLEIKTVLEDIEVAALWLPDCDGLEMKLALAVRCGDGARQLDFLSGRLGALGVAMATFDPRYGGYSKLFAHFRSLQTPEERACAGFVTYGG